MKQSFVFYADWWELINTLPTDAGNNLLRAICEYAFEGALPNDPMTAGAMGVIRVAMDRNAQRWEEIREKRREAGLKSATARCTKNQQVLTSGNTDNKSQQVATPTTVNVNDNVDVNVNQKESRGKHSAFSPPSIDEVKSYIYEKGYNVDAENFMAFYESKDWYVGKNKMHNWKAAVLTWHTRNTKNSTTQIQSDERQQQFAEHIIAKLNTPDSPEPDISDLY